MTVYVGMDVHRKRSQVAIVDAAGAQQRNRNLASADFHAIGSAQGSGELVAEGAVAPPGDGDGSQVGGAEDG